MHLYVGLLREQVNVFELTADGDAPPLRAIVGPNTQLDGVDGVAVDNAGYLYVGNASPSAITVYAPDADGDAAPVRVIEGDQTQLAIPASLALDSAGYLYALNTGGLPPGRTITVYAPGANGNVAPAGTLSGVDVGYGNLNGLAVDSQDCLYVAESVPGVISVYAPNAHGNATPIRRIQGPSARLATVSGMDFDADDNLYLANDTNILVFAAGADGDVAPIRVIEGNLTALDEDFTIAVAPDGTVHAGDCGPNLTTGKVTVYPPGANGNVAPIRTLTNLSRHIPFGGMAIDKPRTPPKPHVFRHLPALVAQIFGGISVDGSGVVVIGGVPHPIGPWGPRTADASARADLLIGMSIEQLATHLADGQRAGAIRAAALEMMKAKVNEMIARLS